MLRLWSFPALLLTLALPVGGGCGPVVDTIDDVKSALESKLGGFQLDDELPGFGLNGLDNQPLPTRVVLPVIPPFGIVAPPADGPTGVFSGLWFDLEKAHGVMAGKWADASGTVRGHLKAYYGKSKLYKNWVFLGKLINNQGTGLGLISGRFDHGRFRGTWETEDGEPLGMLEGTVVGKSGFVGRWNATHRPEPRGVGYVAPHLLR